MRCSYCNLACQFSITSDDIGIVGINYNKEGANQGRLCARGSANEILLKDRRRLTAPFIGTNRTDWPTVLTKIGEMINQYQDRMAITVGSELTVDEYELITGFGRALGVPVIPLNFDGGGGFQYQLKGVKSGNQNDLDRVDRLVTIGDVLSVGPVITHPFHYFHYRKGTRHYHIDFLPSRTQGFADQFLPLTGGDELRGLIGLARGKTDHKFIEDLKSNSTLIIAALNIAKVEDPIGFSLATQYLALTSKAKIILLANSLGWPGDGSIGTVLTDVKEGKIKLILNFGDELFTFSDAFKPIKLISTSIFTVQPRRNWTLLPAPINCEKKGRIRGLSTIEKTDGMQPPSGVYQMDQVLNHIAQRLNITIKTTPYKSEIQVGKDFLFDRIKEVKPKRSQEKFMLYGFSNPLNFHDLFGHPIILLINPKDLVKLKLSDYNLTDVGSKNYRIEAMVRRNSMIPEGSAAITTDSPKTWPLFQISDGFFVPSEVKIWKGKST